MLGMDPSMQSFNELQRTGRIRDVPDHSRETKSYELLGADLLALDQALNRQMVEGPIAARVLEPSQFACLGHEQIFATLGITVYLARQKRPYARSGL